MVRQLLLRFAIWAQLALEVLLALSAPETARAGWNVWTQTGGPEGGVIQALAIDPTSPSTLYAGTGRGGVFKSSNAGASWTSANSSLPHPLSVNTLAIDPTSPSILYAGTTGFAGTTGGGLFKSTDAGATWAPVNSGLPYRVSVNALAIDPTSPSTLYAGTDGLGVVKSNNSGTSWVLVNSGLPDLRVYSLAIDPASPATLYAGIVNGAVYKSTDGGASWVPANSGLPHNFGQAASTVAIDPISPSTLYAGFNGGVFKSTDAGSTWTPANSGLRDLGVDALAIDPISPSTLYAGTGGSAFNGGGVFKSTNAGASWAPANSGLPFVEIKALAIDPTSQATLYAGANGGGVFKSTNAGALWALVNPGLISSLVNVLAIDPASPSTLYAGTQGGGVFKSSNAGTVWASNNSGLTDSYVKTLAIDPSSPSTIYAGTGGGVFKSSNAGSSWTSVNSGLNSNVIAFVITLAIDPTSPSNLYAGTDFSYLNGGVFKTTNAGASWAPINSGLTNLRIYALAIDPASPSTLYAGTNGGGVFKSTNAGASWAPVNSGLTNSSVNALAIDPTSPSTLYSGTYGGVFKSTNAGISWVPVNSGLTNSSIYAVVIDPTSASSLYAGSSGGVFRSSNAGASWAPVNSGLTNSYIEGLALDPNSPSTLYAGTVGDGVFVITFGIEPPTATSIPSPTPTTTQRATLTALNTPSVTLIPTQSSTATSTSIQTVTVTVTQTSPPSATVTVTNTPSPTPTLTETPTATLTPTVTVTRTVTQMSTASETPTAISTSTSSGRPTATPTVTPPIDLVADAVEVTQGIQDWSNSVRLAADKRTFVRLHAHAKTGHQTTSARLVVERGGSSVTLSPINPGAAINVRSGPNRGVLDHAFLFLLPSSMNNAGTVRIRGEVNPQGIPAEGDTSNNAVEATVVFETVPKQTLVLYTVDYELGGRRYTVADRMRQLVSNWLRRAYPVGDLSVVQRTQVVGNAVAVDGILDRPSCFDVNNFLTTKRVFDVTAGSVVANARYYGMVGDDGALLSPSCAAGVPGHVATGAVGATAYGAWDTDGTYGDWLAGRELGHTYGRASAEFCQARQANGYPYANGQISPVLFGPRALYGFDVVIKQIYGPDWKDVMSDCPYVWMSDYTYGGLMDFMQQEGSHARAQRAAAVDRVLVVGTLDPISQHVELEPPFIVSGAAEILVRVPGAYAIVLRNASGAELARYAFTPREAATTGGEPGGSGTLRFMQELVPVVAGMARIEIVGAGGQVLASVSGGGSAPVVRLTAPNGGVLPNAGPVHVQWEASDTDGDALSFAVQYSADDGATWELLAAYVSGNEVAIDASNLDPTQTGRFRVLASDGVHTVSDASDATITVAARTISVRVTSPAVTVSQGQTLLLEAEVSGSTVNEEQVHWTSNRDGELGQGTSLAVTGLSVGVHTITVSVDNGTATATDQVEITVVAEIDEIPPVDQVTAGPSLIRLDLTAGITTATLYIDNANAGQPLSWTLEGIPVWAQASALLGTTPAEVQLGVQSGHKPPGSYQATLTVRGEPGEPVTVALELTVVPCPGDCDGDGQVTMDDLVRGVNAALGHDAMAECLAADADLDGEVTIDELVGAGRRTPGGCTY